MLIYKSLKNLLEITLNWETGLEDLYETAETGLKNHASYNFIIFLKTKQIKNIEILRNLEISDLDQNEFVQFMAEEHTADLIPEKELKQNSAPEEIYSVIRAYEESLEEYYIKIADKLVSDKQRGLFESLSTFKETQIESISNYIEQQIRNL